MGCSGFVGLFSSARAAMPHDRDTATVGRLELKRVSVRFGAVAAVSDVDAVVEPGAITGLIGQTARARRRSSTQSAASPRWPREPSSSMAMI